MAPIDPAHAAPTGVPGDDRLTAAQTVADSLRPRLNLSRPGGLLMGPGTEGQISAAAQVATLLTLTDIAESLRIIAGRETDKK